MLTILTNQREVTFYMRRLMFFYWLASEHDIGFYGTLLFILVRLLLAVFIILLLTFIVRYKNKISDIRMDADVSQNSNDLMQILNERLAKGEVTIEEYQRLKTEILNNNM